MTMDADTTVPELGAAGAGRPAEARGLIWPLSLLDDLWNPILVKEVRQSLRGRLFRMSFMGTLVLAALACTTIIMSMGSNISETEARGYVTSMLLCMGCALWAVVPFATFQSMGSEWEENAYDLLILSDIRPRRIVRGKLLSASVQGLLFVAAFLPFLILSFLLQGVDLLSLLFLVTTSILLSGALSAVALFLSTLTSKRFARIMLLVVLGFLIFGAFGMAGSFSAELLRRPGSLRDRDFWFGTYYAVAIISLVSLVVYVSAANMLSHSEENRSTTLRIVSWIVPLILAIPCFEMGDAELVTIIGSVAIAWLTIVAIFFTTEEERLGRRVATFVPRSPIMGLLASPFLPGGGRGFLQFLLQILFVMGATIVGHILLLKPGGSLLDEGLGGLVVFAAFAICWVGLPSALFSPYTQRPNLRMAARVSIPLFGFLLGFLPALIGFFLGDRLMANGEHVGNPFFTLERATSERARNFTQDPYQMTVLVVTILTIASNLPRVIIGVREVVTVSLRKSEMPSELAA